MGCFRMICKLVGRLQTVQLGLFESLTSKSDYKRDFRNYSCQTRISRTFQKTIEKPLTQEIESGCNDVTGDDWHVTRVIRMKYG